MLITAGIYEKIEATVERGPLDDDTVQVSIKLRSLQRSISVPRACLQLLERSNEIGPVRVTLSVLLTQLREKSQRWAFQIRGLLPDRRIATKHV